MDKPWLLVCSSAINYSSLSIDRYGAEQELLSTVCAAQRYKSYRWSDHCEARQPKRADHSVRACIEMVRRRS